MRSVVLEVRDTRAPEAMAGPEQTGSGSMEETGAGGTEEMLSSGMALLRLGLGASYAAVRAQSGPAAGKDR